MNKADFRLIVHGLDSGKASFLIQNLSEGGFDQPVVVDDFEQGLDWAISTAEADPGKTIALFDGAAIINMNASDEFTRAVVDPAVSDLPWLALVSDGITFEGRQVDNGNYLDHAATPASGPTVGVHDGAPSLVLFRPEGLVKAVSVLTEQERDIDFRGILQSGWDCGLPSYLSGHLRFSVNRSRSEDYRRKNHPRARTWQPKDLSAARPDPSISIAIRTTLTRPYLLRRTVASVAVAAARRPVESVILVGTVDPEALEETRAGLEESFPGLSIEALVTDPVGSSRTTNLLAAVGHATTDYIWFVDDDDMATPHSISAIKDAVHAADRPTIFGVSEAYTETWADDTRPLLMWSQKTETYDPINVLNAFTGTNSLPICSMVIPVELAQTRLRSDLLRHDLGEDYALLLLLLTATGATFTTVSTDIAHISLRHESDSVVTYQDRTPWLQNLAGFMADLYTDPMASNQVAWQFGAGLHAKPNEDDVTENLRLRVQDLLQQRSELERALANMRDWASTIQSESPASHLSARGKAGLKRLVPPSLRPMAAKVYRNLRS